MFKIHTRNSETKIVDLHDEETAKLFIENLKKRDFQNELTGMAVLRECGGKIRCPVCKKKTIVCKNCNNSFKENTCKTGVLYSITRPKDFRNIFYLPEHLEPEGRNKGGERITVFADNIKIVLMAHKEQPSLRVTLSKPGYMKYNPF